MSIAENRQGPDEGTLSLREDGSVLEPEFKWRRQKSEERAPTPTPHWRRRRAASEEAPLPWRRQGHEMRPREASPDDWGSWRSRAPDGHGWRTHPHRREWREGGSQWRQ